jgi:putative Ca2+/H+ antiporter (TMEM165/GDT1 family)
MLICILLASECGDKTQILAVSMTPGHGFAPVAIGGSIALFITNSLAVFLGKRTKKACGDQTTDYL